MKNIILLSLLLIFPLACTVQTGSKSENKPEKVIYHFVFEMDRDSNIDYNKAPSKLTDELFESLREKIDLLALKKIRISMTGKNVFVITYEKTVEEPEPQDIIDAIQPEKLPIPSKLITFFECE